MLTTLIFIPDDEIQSDALYGIMYITDDPNESNKNKMRPDQEIISLKYRLICDSQIIEKIVKFLQKDSCKLHPAIRSLGNISSEGNPMCDKQMVEAGIFAQCKLNICSLLTVAIAAELIEDNISDSNK